MGGEHLQDHPVNLYRHEIADLAARESSARLILTGKPTMTVPPVSLPQCFPAREELALFLVDGNDESDPVGFRNCILSTTGILAVGQCRQLPRCPSWEPWPQETYFSLFCGPRPACPRSHLSDVRRPVSSMVSSPSPGGKELEMDSLDHKTASVSSHRSHAHRNAAVLERSFAAGQALSEAGLEREVRVRHSQWPPLVEPLAVPGAPASPPGS